VCAAATKLDKHANPVYGACVLGSQWVAQLPVRHHGTEAKAYIIVYTQRQTRLQILYTLILSNLFSRERNDIVNQLYSLFAFSLVKKQINPSAKLIKQDESSYFQHS